MAQAAFFYYNPDSGHDNRQHDLFTPQPSAILRSSPMQPQELAMQQYYMSAIATPKPMYKQGLFSQEPHVLSLDTEFGFDDQNYPRTPGLSTSGSAVSSPPQSVYLPTPTNGFFENLHGVKEGCEREVKSEILSAGIDWSRSGSPPLTPGMQSQNSSGAGRLTWHSHSASNENACHGVVCWQKREENELSLTQSPVFVHPPSVTASQASDLLSTTASCPSLSPSPSPAPQSTVSETDSFCDPRNLLVSAKPQPPLINQLDIPTLPAFIPSSDDLLLGVNPSAPGQKSIDASNVSLDALAPIFDGVSSFDSFSDLDSEHDFITDLSQDCSAVYLGAKRQRLNSIPFSEGELTESSFDDELTAMSVYAPTANQQEPPAKRPRSSRQVKSEDIDFDFASTYASSNTEVSTPAVPNAVDDNKDDAAAIDSPSGDASTSAQQQTNRRGRKQSLTEDPSKTFVCTLCSRRFRRQEHLKRHYRSLHTQDKPFECTDCGKKFSRSDNLAQHARTHGNTTGLLGLTGLMGEGMATIDEKTATMGAMLFEAAAAVGSSSSTSGSDDEKAMKKRKRDE